MKDIVVYIKQVAYQCRVRGMRRLLYYIYITTARGMNCGPRTRRGSVIRGSSTHQEGGGERLSKVVRNPSSSISEKVEREGFLTDLRENKVV